MKTKLSFCVCVWLAASGVILRAQSGGGPSQPPASDIKMTPEQWAWKLSQGQHPSDLPEGTGPANDDCANALPISDGDTAFSNDMANTDGPTTCANLNNDIWYNYTASATGTAVVSLCNTTFYDTVLVAYAGCACPVGTELACNDDFCGLASASQASFDVTAGQCYKLRVGSWVLDVTGSGNINISVVVPPPNNQCANALPISEGDTPFSTVNATTDGEDHAACYFGFASNINQDIWYLYTPSCSGDITVGLCAGATPYDSKMAIYNGCGNGCPSPESDLINCDDDGCAFAGYSQVPGQNPTPVSVIAGNCYTIRVGGYGGASGEGTINITNTGSPCVTPVTIASANPPASNPYGAGKFRDVLQNSTTALAPQGIGFAGTQSEGSISYAPISVTFSGTITPAPSAANITRSCTDIAGNGQADCPNVTTVTGSGAGPYMISLSAPPPPRECITFAFMGTVAGQKLQYQALPGDTNLDGNVNTQDLLFLVQATNNGSANTPANRARFNINRSNEAGGVVVNTQDFLREVQLLNGTNATQVFNGATVAACP